MDHTHELLGQLLSPLGRTPIFLTAISYQRLCLLLALFFFFFSKTLGFRPKLFLCASRPAHLADSCTVSLSPVKHALQTSSVTDTLPLRVIDPCLSVLMGYSQCLVQHNCVKLVTFERYFPLLSDVSLFLSTHVWHHLLGCRSPRDVVCTLSVLFVKKGLKLICISSGFQTCLRMLLVLGNLVDKMHPRNLHDLLQSGCSEHLHLHFRIFRVRDWLLDLFLLHYWDFSSSYNELPQFSVPHASLAPASKFQESQSKIENDSSSVFLHGTHWRL